MELDIRTLSFMATLSNFLMAVALFTLWWVNRNEKATSRWMIGALAMGVGFLLIGLRHQIPPAVSIVVANLLILAGFFLQCRGVYLFLRKPTNLLFDVGLFAVVGTGFVYFTYAEPDVAMRIVIISWAVALLAFLTALALVKDMRRGFSLPEMFIAGIFILYSTFMAARGAYAIYEQAIADFMSAGTLHAISLIVIVALSISLSVGYAVMVTVSLNRRLVHEIDVKNRFFSIVAHDLRSPFTVLNGYTSQFRRLTETKSREELIKYAEDINRSASAALGLVENLLEWSRGQLNAGAVVIRSLGVAEVVARALEPMQAAASTKRLKIDVRVGDETVLADSDMLATVLRNLIDNAIKFSGQGQEIAVMSRLEGDSVIIAVQNTGARIDPAMRADIFYVGNKTSTKGTGGEKGSGLGLPLCRDLLRKIDGDIRIDDDWTDGTRFVVTLPAGAETTS
ncbi:MAG: HAMP domain-containing sensor histidine kinase [Rhodospirillales bacterium]